ncbi:cytochrome c peroxidase [Chitinivorax tropicus]|uniref:Cytochrome c peroxidase n=1 Tax=Chitinivorax tropicus TaxID=714531 RepID=A0A840MMA1_9PROT|nr:methanobactin export MATE transporter MbnM [Chitinivorax tropicus]MBB5018605.1 cytochrome c peroxidase [Chitinivorax tropicus]
MKRWPVVIMGLGMALAAVAGTRYDWPIPAWAPTPLVPKDNPMTPAKVALGRALFYDKRLSANQTQACAGCHLPDKSFSDGLSLAKGSTGELGKRNAMALVNVAYLPTLTWANPNITSLEQQILNPLFGEHPIEMGMAGKEQLLFERLRADPDYPRLFKQAFPAQKGEISLKTLTRAIASFERSLLSFDSPYDRYRYGGQRDAISPSAKRGEQLFFGERLECYHCHGGINFTDNQIHRMQPLGERGFHNTGLYNEDGQGAYPPGASGLREFTQKAADEGKFRTPGLRNIALTAPYMHDGSLPTLQAVVRLHYAQKGRAGQSGAGPNPLRSQFIQGFQITDEEVADLVAFLESLTDQRFIDQSVATQAVESSKRKEHAAR